ncbi:MAG: hypothetical protein NVV74_25200 [Magnetospirillum sp.]|nr:hypothetical protein [Magnetospirillum sp.]
MAALRFLLGVGGWLLAVLAIIGMAASGLCAGIFIVDAKGGWNMILMASAFTVPTLAVLFGLFLVGRALIRRSANDESRSPEA